MAASAIGALRVTLGIDTAAFSDGLGIATKRMTAAGKNLQAIGGKIAMAGAGMSAAISLPLAAIAKGAVEGALAQRQAMAQVEAGLKSMGAASGRTADQMAKNADALELNSLFDADLILTKVTANLLTFGNVAGAQFDRAQQAALDLAQRMGGDLQGATIMIGKALNDPVKGISALSRVGIQLTEDQKNLIKQFVATGRAADAQKIILGELERQFGGSAAAAADTDPYRKMQVALGQAGDAIGERLLPLIPPLTSALTTLLGAFSNLDPTVQTFIIGAAATAAAIGPIAIGVGGMVSAFGLVIPALAPVATFLTAVLIPAAVATAPVWAPIAAAVGLAAGAFALLIKYQPQIDAFGAAVVARMQALYVGVKTWLWDKLNVIFDNVRSKVSGVGDAFYKLWDRVVGHSYVPDMVDAIGAHMGRLDANMVDAAEDATKTTAEKFSTMAEGVVGTMQGLFNSIRSKDWGGLLGGILNAAKQLGVFGSAATGGSAQTYDLGGLGSSTSVGQGDLPGFATGGSFQVRGMSGVDKNMLSLNGRPIARVSHGETVGIGRGSGSAGGVMEVRLRDDMLDARIITGSARVTQAGIQQNNSQQSKYAGRKLGR